MALVTLHTIFQDAFPAYEQTHPLPTHVRKAARAIMQCRTAVLGGHVQACPDGHMARVWYNSCRHRSCPQCAYLQTERWLALQQARLLACDHYHVIFTLPHDLNPLWLANVPVMSTLLFQAVRDSVVELLADPKYLGAQPGSSPRSTPGARPWCCIPMCMFGHGWRSDARRALEGRPPWVSAPGTGRHVGVSGQDARRHPACVDSRRVGGAGGAASSQQVLNLLNRLGHPTKTRWNVRIMERYAARGRGGDLSACWGRAVPSRTPASWPGMAAPPPARHEEADGARPGGSSR